MTSPVKSPRGSNRAATTPTQPTSSGLARPAAQRRPRRKRRQPRGSFTPPTRTILALMILGAVIYIITQPATSTAFDQIEPALMLVLAFFFSRR